MSDRLRAVLFDLDGTLIDWSQSRDAAMRARHVRSVLAGLLDTLTGMGLQVPPLDDVVQEYLQRISQALKRDVFDLRPLHLGDILVDTLVAAGMNGTLPERNTLLQAFPWSAIPGVVCFPDAPAALQTLHDHGILVGLVTNSSYPMLLRDRELEAFGLLHLIPDCRLSAADAGRLKPHPHIFRAALKRLGVKPAEAVFVGDNPVPDIAGAQNAGMRAVLRSGWHETQELALLIEPDARLESLAELPAILDDWHPGWRA